MRRIDGHTHRSEPPGNPDRPDVSITGKSADNTVEVGNAASSASDLVVQFARTQAEGGHPQCFAPRIGNSIMTSPLKNFARRADPRDQSRSSRGIVFALDRATLVRAGIAQSDIDFLTNRLLSDMRLVGWARYEGQSEIDGQTVLRFSAARASALESVLLAAFADISWCHRARLSIQSDNSAAWTDQLVS
jgi:hypothetical protein